MNKQPFCYNNKEQDSCFKKYFSKGGETMGLGHKIKKGVKHGVRMGKYALEEGGMHHTERVKRREEIRNDSSMRKKKKESVSVL